MADENGTRALDGAKEFTCSATTDRLIFQLTANKGFADLISDLFPSVAENVIRASNSAKELLTCSHRSTRRLLFLFLYRTGHYS